MSSTPEVNYEVDHEVNYQVRLDPWSILPGSTQLPCQVEEKKKRGRPRKHRNNPNGKIVHRMDNNPPDVAKQLPHDVVQQLTEDFRKFYKLHKLSLRLALNEIAKRYEISYNQAYTMLKTEI